ncbi:PAS domain S-box protein [Candidatus Magnetominusculus xianensis]|uniref:histidine kinase n=1 Tax=Candidatus Magnetominusculus xianensis TaxID=1748249 RepID=A0ABR5SBY8_9BACT|nr:PAS domain S-box protein [Candidatus Magnetominusculus xianensis]KWT78354.1 putative sensor histidine kinase [Candidatus Magnetominusculus xianensis]MBF0402892.1 PAS domain S-box protein [Nitrospirota bacterium]
MTKRQKPSNRFPLKIFVAVFSFSMVIIVFIGWRTWQMHGSYEKLSTKHVTITQTVGLIMLCDEVLTMSARMAAATGDFSYEQRYDQFDLQLEKYINDLRSAIPQAEIKQFINETYEANAALVAMERRSFALAHQGKLNEASALLNSDEYMRLKNKYALGMERTVAAARRVIANDTQRLHSRFFSLVVAVTMTVLATLMVWFYAITYARRWGIELMKSTERRRVEEELSKIEWLLKPKAIQCEVYTPAYGDITKYNKERTILDTLGTETLTNIVNEFMGLLETSSAVYEKNGDYATGIFSSGWCQLLDKASFKLCNTDDVDQALSSGKWSCHESCWSEASKTSIESGKPTDIECAGGIHLYAVPIRCGKEIIGSINFGYGDPPKDPEKLSELASKFHVDVKELSNLALGYQSRPQFVIDIAKLRLSHAADFIGMMVERKRAEAAIYKSEEKLQKIIDSSPTVIFVKDLAGRYLLINSLYENLFHVSKNEIIGKTDYDIFPIEAAKAFRDADLEVLKANKPLEVEERVPQDDGIHNYISMKFPLYGSEGKPYAVCAIATDITDRKKMERYMAQTKERYDLATSVGNIGVWDWNIVTGKVAWNDEVFKILDIPTGELEPSYEIFTSLVHPDDRKHFIDNVTGALQSRQPFDCEYRVLLANAKVRVCHALGNLTLDESGKPVRLMGTFQDITERRKAEAAIIDSEQRYRMLFEQSNDAVFIHDMDGNIRNANTQAAKLMGVPLETLSSMNVSELHPPEELDNSRLAFIETIKEGHVSFESKFRRSTGELVDVDINAGIIDRNKGVIQGIARDITKRKKMEIELKDSEEDLNRAQAIAQIGSWRLNIPDNRLKWSAEVYRMAGIPEQGSINLETFISIIHPDDRDNVLTAWTEALGGVPYDIEHRMIVAGQTIWVRERAEIVRDSEGQPLYGIGTVQNITEHKKTEEQIKQSLREKESLLREIHHRVKNNLAIVTGLLALQARTIEDTAVKQLFEESKQRVKSMSLVHEKLYQTPDLSSINFAEYIESIVSEIVSMYRIDTNAITSIMDIENIELDLEAAVPCGLIVNELLTNAFKYAFPDKRRGIISVHFTKTDQTYTLTIKDNGIGLPEGFDYQKSDTMGLQLVTALAGQLDGMLQIKSKDGLEAVVMFPVKGE